MALKAASGDGGGTLGVDFGTSNSAAAWCAPGGQARAVPLEDGAASLPTAVFFQAEDRSVQFGRAAMAQYLAGTEGRLMRSLKSLLGSSLMQERTDIHGRPTSFVEIIALFLGELRQRCEQTLGTVPQRIVMGRPVHFVDDDPERDALAEATLREAARQAGWPEVQFLREPIAAALDYERRLDREQTVLVADIGGGTSDFTMVRLGPGRWQRGGDRAGDLLATRGVHVGGTDFDQRLSVARVMPLLGLGHRGPHGREVPSGVFHDLATWHLIHWRYLPRALREAEALRHDYTDLALHARLMQVLHERLGHWLAHEVERAKIAASQGAAQATAGPARLDLGLLEPGLAATLGAAEMAQDLREPLQRVVDCAVLCARDGGWPAQRLDAVYLTGGSAALAPFQAALRAALPGVPLVEGDLFGGVAAGLAMAPQ